MSERAGLVLLDGELRPGRVVFEGGFITGIVEDDTLETASLPILAPGLVDLHVHGLGGAEPREDLEGMARALARAGTTSFQPTLFPRRSPAALGEEAERVWRFSRELVGGTAARVLGLHLEGPFVNPRAAGGLPRDELAEPSVEGLGAILGSSTGDGRGIRTITLAPELPGAVDLVAELARGGVRASLGHSLATLREADAALGRGAAGATHLFNAMRPFHHREVGLAGLALTAPGLAVEIIGDLVHVGVEAFEIALRARGPLGLCLVSDALNGAASGRDRFCCNGRDCFVADGAAWFHDPQTPEGRRLTGSVTSQLEAVRRLVGRGVVGPAEALRMASETPARALGVHDEVGRLIQGGRADLLVLEGPNLELREVLVGGAPIA